MRRGVRTVCYDEELKIEAYQLEGIVQSFPNHFHEYYVIGFIENGERYMSCKNVDYTIRKGHIVLFNPKDNHSCTQLDGNTFSYRGFNIETNVMLDLVEEVTGERALPKFHQNVVFDEELSEYLLPLHKMVMDGVNDFEKEEHLLVMMTMLLRRYSKPFQAGQLECSSEIEKACAYLHTHYQEHIYLEQLCKEVGLSKSSILRGFTKYKGITPYRYLVTIRVNEAKKLLEQGLAPIEVANQTGFVDQSHFTNFFTNFIGIAPGIYRDIFLKKETNKEKAEE